MTKISATRWIHVAGKKLHIVPAFFKNQLVSVYGLHFVTMLANAGTEHCVLKQQNT